MSPEPTHDFVARFAACEQEVYRYVCTLLGSDADAEDVMQETAAALWRKFDEYDPAQPFVPWAVRFAYIEVLRHRKQARQRGKYFSETLIETLADERDKAQPLLEAQRRALTDCLEKLPGAQRDLLNHRYGRDSTIHDLAAASHQPVATLYKTLHRVRRRLLDCVTLKLKSEGFTP